MTESSNIHYGKHGDICFTGPDAVAFFRAAALASALKLYARAKIIATRGLTATRLLKLATEITKKPYKRGEHAKAALDVEVWAKAMKLALPTTDDRKG